MRLCVYELLILFLFISLTHEYTGLKIKSVTLSRRNAKLEPPVYNNLLVNVYKNLYQTRSTLNKRRKDTSLDYTKTTKVYTKKKKGQTTKEKITKS